MSWENFRDAAIAVITSVPKAQISPSTGTLDFSSEKVPLVCVNDHVHSHLNNCRAEFYIIDSKLMTAHFHRSYNSYYRHILYLAL